MTFVMFLIVLLDHRTLWQSKNPKTIIGRTHSIELFDVKFAR